MNQRTRDDRIPVIDLFAGPGGLGEGFASLGGKHPRFRIALSVEMDGNAHRTLQLRSFFRQFSRSDVPEEYYDLLRGKAGRRSRWTGAVPTSTELFDLYRREGQAALAEAWRHELGTDDRALDGRIREALGNRIGRTWVLIGGPPCQAYSLVGRSRNRGKAGYRLEDDHRSTLYRHYLRVIAEHRPTAFVMENVKGLLSTRIESEALFERIRSDLQRPLQALHARATGALEYHLFAVASPELRVPRTELGPSDFLVRTERLGLPQARHRVVILGIRRGSGALSQSLLESSTRHSIEQVIGDLPALRSGISRCEDDGDRWIHLLKSFPGMRGVAARQIERPVLETIEHVLKHLRVPEHDRGAPFLPGTARPEFEPNWYADKRLQGFCNHETRSHMASDLYRYLYCAAFAQVAGASPTLDAFPPFLMPEHRNARFGDPEMIFGDRFRVQRKGSPSTTITSHIGKDGHYYIHYDPAQCRSLTVREAARLQTFPDNYLFCGPRTSQYVQVGNAVPPLLANRIAGLLLEAIS